MTLRLRLGLLIGLIVFAGFGLFGSLAYVLFVQTQDRQLEATLLRELTRAQQLFSGGVASLGQSFISDNDQGLRLQVFLNDTEILLTSGVSVIDDETADETAVDAFRLPAFASPTVTTFSERRFLVATVPWLDQEGQERSGSLRMALDIEDAMQARASLPISLLLSGLLITFITMVVSLILIRRSLLPLSNLAARARAINPADPDDITYGGPQDEVADVAHGLNVALDGIRERQKAERASLAEIAHELAAPLTLVSGHLDSFANEFDDSRLRAARDAANELLYTSKDLLTLARGELERSFNLQIFNLAQTVNKIALEYEGVTVSGLEFAEVAGDPERLSQLVRNLVRNAVQACNSCELVSICLSEDGDWLRLEVADRGPGISPEDLEHLFDRFYSKKQGGAGVGLSVAKQIAQHHGGDISVTTVLGEGTRFCVTLPSLSASFEEDISHETMVEL